MQIILNPVCSIIGMHWSNYSKIEKNQRENSLVAVEKIAGYLNILIYELILGDDVPKEISLEDKTIVSR